MARSTSRLDAPALATRRYLRLRANCISRDDIRVVFWLGEEC